MRVDGDSGHGAANFVGNGVSVTAVSKTTKQERIKHHSVETKLLRQQARTMAHRMMLAAVKRSFGRDRRPRGRRT